MLDSLITSKTRIKLLLYYHLIIFSESGVQINCAGEKNLLIWKNRTRAFLPPSSLEKTGIGGIMKYIRIDLLYKN